MKGFLAGKVHIKDAETPTKALCGAGYNWPSAVMFEKEEQPATCKECLERIKEKKKKELGLQL